MEGGDPMLAVRKKEKKEKKEKKGKKEKKEKKRKKKKEKKRKKESNEDCHITDDPNVKPESCLDRNTFQKLDQTSGSGVSCWSDAFAIASSVTPLTLGDDFDSEDEIEPNGGDIGLVSRIAMEYVGASKSLSVDTNAKMDEPQVKSDKKRDVNAVYHSKDDAAHLGKQEVNPSSNKKRRTEHKRKSSSDQPPITTAVKETDVKKSVNDHFPFPTDPDDHCESPVVAYEDILPILEKLAEMKHGKRNLRIYDPYYCDGSVVSNLSKLGFDNVYNKMEDCYETWSESNMTQTYPNYDVLVSNPPYSNDHIQRLIQHVTSKSPKIGKLGTEPWCLLLPTFVHKKDYYKDIIKKASCQPFYIVPRKRYVYIPPKNFREKKASDVHKKSSPFVSMWYIWGGTKDNNEMLITAFRAQERTSRCDIARSKSALRDLRRNKK